jgi:3'-5' exoribonuclease
MDPPCDLRSLQEGAPVDTTLLVCEVRRREQANGDPYTLLELGNGSGTIDSEPFWLNRQDEVRGLREGHVVAVTGHISRYRERLQLKVKSLRVLTPDRVDWRALLPSVGDPAPYWELLDGWRRAIDKPRLRAVLALFYDDDDFRSAYESCPAAVRGHHAALGGLLKHTAEVATIGRAIARTSGGDADLVLAGALLHDIGKLESYRWDGAFRMTVRGRLLGHVVLGALALEERWRSSTPPPCTPDERDILLHFILSHHGHLEYGSPVRPSTLEADILHWADNASAKTTSFADVLAAPEQFDPDGFSPSQWTLDRRRVYRGTSDWGRAEDAAAP